MLPVLKQQSFFKLTTPTHNQDCAYSFSSSSPGVLIPTRLAPEMSISSVVSIKLCLSFISEISSSSMKSSGRETFCFARSEREERNVEGVHPVYM